MRAIAKVFERLKIRGEGALIGYITAGDPSPSCTPLIAEALIYGGVDILELGLPFSDPIAGLNLRDILSPKKNLAINRYPLPTLALLLDGHIND